MKEKDDDEEDDRETCERLTHRLTAHAGKHAVCACDVCVCLADWMHPLTLPLGTKRQAVRDMESSLFFSSPHFACSHKKRHADMS